MDCSFCTALGDDHEDATVFMLVMSARWRADRALSQAVSPFLVTRIGV